MVCIADRPRVRHTIRAHDRCAMQNVCDEIIVGTVGRRPGVPRSPQRWEFQAARGRSVGIEGTFSTSTVVAAVKLMLELGRYDCIRDTLKHPCASAEDLPLSMTRMQGAISVLVLQCHSRHLFLDVHWASRAETRQRANYAAPLRAQQLGSTLTA